MTTDPELLPQLRAAVDRQAAGFAATKARSADMLRERVLSERDWYGAAAKAALSADLGRIVSASQSAVALQTDTYLAHTGSLIVGKPVQPVGVGPRAGRTWRGGDLTHEQVYDRIGVEYRFRRSQGQAERDARAAVAERAVRMGHADAGLAFRGQADVFVRGRRRYRFAYRRIVRPELSQGNVCGLCIVAADQIYYRGDLMPIHNGCLCSVMLITPASDPGALLNREQLDALYAEGGGTDYRSLRRIKVSVEEHGELGPVLTNRLQHFRGPADVAASAAAPAQAEVAATVAARPDPLATYDLAAMTDSDLDDLMLKLASEGDWQSSERVGEFLDARAAAETPQPWRPDPRDAFNDRTFEWYEQLPEAEQWAFTDRMTDQMASYFHEEQWAWSSGKQARAALTPERQLREMWDRQLDMEMLTLENATNGFTLNPRAVAEGRSPRDLFHVNEQTAYAWASEETKRYWAEAGGRPTWGRFKAVADGGTAAADARYAMSKGVAF